MRTRLSLAVVLGGLAIGLAPALPSRGEEAKKAAKIIKKVLESASILWTNVDAGKQKIAPFMPLIDQRAASLVNEVNAAYQLQAGQRSVPAALPAMTAEEREASNLIVEQVGGGGGRGGGGGGVSAGGGGASLCPSPPIPSAAIAMSTPSLRTLRSK